MNERKYSRKCGNCGQKTMAIVVVPYRVTVDHNGIKYTLFLPNLSVPQCSSCRELSIDDEADKQIRAAFCQEADLLKNSRS
jgi:hypothetical protein